MKKKFFLIGSCYSGYMFKEKLLGSSSCSNLELVFQHQHDSLISIMTKPFDIDISNAKSNYQWDFNHFAETIFKKNIFEKMITFKPDYLVLDNYVEIKCPLIEIDNETYITKNYYIETSTIFEQLKSYPLVKVFEKKRIELYEQYAKKFLSRVEKELPGTKIIIVKAKAATSLRNINGSIVPFKDVQILREENKLRKIYDKKLEKLTNAYVLDMTDCCYPADARIKEQYNYDASSNHYNANYYLEEYGRLKNIVIQDLLGGEKAKSKYFNQAIIILLKNDIKMAYLQCRIYKDFFKVYVCVDSEKAGSDFKFDDIERISSLPNVYVITDYKLYGGSMSELEAVLEATDMAFEGDGIECVHFALDNDIPITPINRIYNYFEINKGISYLNLFADGDIEEMKKIEDNTFRYYFYDEDIDNDEMVSQVGLSINEQKEKGVYRKTVGGFELLYKGVFGGTLSKDAYLYCKSYLSEHESYLEDIKYIRQRAEFFFHTILFNSVEFKNKIKWGKRGGKHAWYWDEKNKYYKSAELSDYNKIRENDFYLFLRGIKSSNTSLINKILEDIKSPYRI